MRPSCFRRAAWLTAGILGMVVVSNASATLPDFIDATDQLLIGTPAVLQDDPEEKDLMEADLDRDGDQDLIVVRKIPFTMPGPRPDVLLMNENGVLTERTDELAPDLNLATNSRDVQIVDLDGDDWLDVVLANTFDQPPVILMNQGHNGTWLGLVRDDTRLATLPQGPKFCAVGVGDITGNGAPDLYFVDYENDLEDRLWINDGNGFFTDETEARIGSNYTDNIFGTAAEIHDMNMDGFNDIIVTHALENTHILYNDGTGHFPSSPTTEQLLNTSSSYMFSVGYFNNDDRPDVYVVQDGQDQVIFNLSTNANGTIATSNWQPSTSQSPRTTGFGGNCHIADIDRDSDNDLSICDIDIDISGCDREATALENPGDGHLFDPYTVDQAMHRPTFDARLVDVDGDGWRDLYMGWCNGTVILRQEPLNTTAIEQPQLTPPVTTLLRQNRPNPFYLSTVIEYDLGTDALGDAPATLAVLSIYDVQGRLIRSMVEDAAGAGVHRIAWDGRNNAGDRVRPGVYFYQLEAAGKVMTRKLSVLE